MFQQGSLLRLKKFNGGKGAILCNRCLVIIKEGFADYGGQITKEDWEDNSPIFCDKCSGGDNNGAKSSNAGRVGETPTG